MKKGFTIIELIVVIAIIAVLAAVVAVDVMRYVAKAKDAAVLGSLKIIKTAATDYFYANGSYSNLCGSDKIIQIRLFISQQYPSECFDNTNSPSVCLTSQYKALVTKPSSPGKYMCVSGNASDFRSPDMFVGSSDVSQSGCVCK